MCLDGIWNVIIVNCERSNLCDSINQTVFARKIIYLFYRIEIATLDRFKRRWKKQNKKIEWMWCVGTESIYPINDKMLRFWKIKCSSNRKVFITLKSACAIKSRYSIWLCISHSYTMDDCKAYSENRFPIQLLNTAFIFMLSLFTPNLPASIRKRFLKLQGIENVMRKTKSKIDKEEKEDDRMN